MKKSLLSKVPVKKATKAYVSLAKRVNVERYLISAEIIKINGNATLVMYFYNISDVKNGSKKAAFRTFITYDDYITQNLYTNKWKTGCLMNLLYYHWYKYCIIADNKSSDIIKKFLKTNNEPLQEIASLQEKIMAKRLFKKHQIIIDKIDKQMEKVPELPEDFYTWIDETVLLKSRYIYYTYKPGKKKLDGYCTHCKTDVTVEGPKHNKTGICPHCGSPVTFKAIGKSHNVSDYAEAVIIQKVDDGIIARYFKLYKNYYDHYKEPTLSCNEMTRDFYDKAGEIRMYEWLKFMQTREYRWCNGRYKYGYNNAILYKSNLDEVLSNTVFKYSAIKKYAEYKSSEGFDPYNYFTMYKKYPAIEYLVKLGLYKLVDIAICGYPYDYNTIMNMEGKTFKEVLNINKLQLATAKRINANIRELEVIKKAAAYNVTLTDEQIHLIAQFHHYDEILWVAQKYTTINRIIKYLKSQITETMRITDIYNDWRDYINNCKILQYKLSNEFVLFPKNLKDAHDIAYKLLKESRTQILNKAINKISHKLNKVYSWEYKNYLIVVPDSADAIIREGQILHHCVGTYVEKVAREESVILFLREKEKPEKPFYTIEVNPYSKEIMQCRGMSNTAMTEEIKNVVNKYFCQKLKPILSRQAA